VKSKRNVRDMNVLNDIRGLLSSTPEENPLKTAELGEEPDLLDQVNQYKEEIDRLKVRDQQQQTELEKLKIENEELVANLNLLRSTKNDEEAGLNDELRRYKDEIEKIRHLSQKQQEELEKLREENKGLVVNLDLIRAARDERPVCLPPLVDTPNDEIYRLEAQKNELSMAISELEGLLQLKLKELLKRVARVCQDAGENGMAIEFRKSTTLVEPAEKLAYFVQALANT